MFISQHRIGFAPGKGLLRWLTAIGLSLGLLVPSAGATVMVALASPLKYFLNSAPTLTTNGGRVDWSTDGQWVYRDAINSSGKWDVYKIRTDGTGDVCLTCNRPELSPGDKGNPTVDASGRYLVFQAELPSHPSVTGAGTGAGGPSGSGPTQPGGGWYNDLWVLDQTTNVLTQLTHVNSGLPAGGSLHPHFNHDGTKLLWSDLLGSGGRFGTWQLATATFSPSGTPALTNRNNYQPGAQKLWYEAHGWAPDDSWVYFACAPLIGQDEFSMDICRMDFAKPTVATRLTFTSGLNGEPAEWDEHGHLSPAGDVMSWVSSHGYPTQTYPPYQSWLTTEVWLMNPDGSGKTQATYFNTPGHLESLPGRNIAADMSWNPAATNPAQLVVAMSPSAIPTNANLILNFSPTPPPPPRPLALTPGSGQAGAALTIAGGAFDSGEMVSVTGPSFTKTATAATDGSISISTSLDPMLAPGTYTVFARGTTSTLFQSTTMVVSASTEAVSLSPSTARAGAPITVNLSGFGPGEDITVTGPQSGGTVKTNSAGTATLSFTPWSTTQPGSYEVTARGRTTGRVASTTLTLTAVAASVAMSPSSAGEGTSVTATANGFVSGESVAFSGVGFFGTATADASGKATASSTLVTNYPAGSYLIQATGRTSGQTATGHLQVSVLAGGGPPTATVTANTTPVIAGSNATLSVKGFNAGESIKLSVQGLLDSTLSGTADASGAATFSVAVPYKALSGNYLISANGSPSRAYAIWGVTARPASMSLTPKSVRAGSSVTLTGANYQPGEVISIASPSGNPSATADANGAWTASVTLLDYLPSGTLSLGATGQLSKQRAVQPLAVTARTPTLTVNPTSAALAQAITVSGSGMTAGDSILLTGPFTSTTVTADASGAFSASTVVGTWFVAGNYVVTALDVVSGMSADTSITILPTQ